ncbi:MAG: hypothetical protein JWM47_1126 [Acidimicrobiales bacterium]|nr:hypothetical protein [Acidimicrobiales bacterium]
MPQPNGSRRREVDVARPLTGPAALSLPRLAPEGVRTAHRTVTDRLRQAILAGELPAGTRLIQADLAESLAVSVTPVREALRDLAGEGLIDFDPFRGAVVHPPSLEELEEIYELRRLLTPVSVAAGVAQATAEDLDRLAALERELRSAVVVDDWINLNRQFHRTLDGLAGRPRLQEILGRLADLSALYVGVSIGGRKTRRARADRDHAGLIAAYRTGDADTAIEISLRHLDDTVEMARRSLRAHP